MLRRDAILTFGLGLIIFDFIYKSKILYLRLNEEVLVGVIAASVMLVLALGAADQKISGHSGDTQKHPFRKLSFSYFRLGFFSNWFGWLSDLFHRIRFDSRLWASGQLIYFFIFYFIYYVFYLYFNFYYYSFKNSFSLFLKKS